MVGLLTAVGTALVAMVVSIVAGIILQFVTENPWVHTVKTFLITGGFAVYTAAIGSLAFFIILTAPIWIGFILGILYLAIKGPLARRGYLGRVPKWMNEIDDDDTDVQAALLLLDQDEIEEVSQVSANADDFKQNLIEKAGVGGTDVNVSE